MGQLNRAWEQARNTAQLVSTSWNLGYGMAHNLAIAKSSMNYHLVPNPDALLVRGFGPPFLKKTFKTRIAYYEMRDQDPDKVRRETDTGG
jgi:hypothetical protein